MVRRMRVSLEQNGTECSMAQNTPLIEVLRELSFSPTPSSKSIADFLLLEGTGISELSMASVAGATYTSKPTLVRFAKTLGFDGWQDFRAEFLEQARIREERTAHDADVDVNYPFSSQDSPLIAVRGLARLKAFAYEKVEESLDGQVLDQAAELVMGSRGVLLFGRRPSYSYGDIFAYNLQRLGVYCNVADVDRADFFSNHLGSDDCVIFSSYSGLLVKEPFTNLVRLTEAGVRTIGVTSARSPLANACTCPLTFEPLERYYDKITGFYSCACIEHILDALFAACYLRGYDANRKASEQLAVNLRRRTNVDDVLRA